MFQKNFKCRLCNSNSLESLFKLNPTPLANNLKKRYIINPKKYPLELKRCIDCSHVQLSIVISSSTLFKSYNYVTGISDSFIKHFNKYSVYVSDKLIKDHKFKIIDIGSNDAIFLKQFPNYVTKIAVEPAKNLINYYNNDIDLYNDFFNKKTVGKIKKKYELVDIVTANNVFAHIDNLKDIVSNVNLILKDKGFFIFEVSYFPNMLKSLSFDNIYHEHLSYHTMIPIISFMKKFSFLVKKVLFVNTHGGSIRVICQKKKNIPRNTKEVLDIIKTEKTFYKSLNSKIYIINKYMLTLGSDIKKIISENLFIGYGCPAKAMTFIYNVDLPYANMPYIIDDNVLKQEKFIPGYNIKIVNKKNVNINVYKYILVFSWNVYNDIIKNNKSFFKNKTIIIPLPKLRIINC